MIKYNIAMLMKRDYYLDIKKYYDDKGLDWRESPDRHQIESALKIDEIYTTKIIVNNDESIEN